MEDRRWRIEDREVLKPGGLPRAVRQAYSLTATAGVQASAWAVWPAWLLSDTRSPFHPDWASAKNPGPPLGQLDLRSGAPAPQKEIPKQSIQDRMRRTRAASSQSH